MKITTLAILIAALALTLFLVAPNLAWTGDDSGVIDQNQHVVRNHALSAPAIR